MKSRTNKKKVINYKIILINYNNELMKSKKKNKINNKTC